MHDHYYCYWLQYCTIVLPPYTRRKKLRVIIILSLRVRFAHFFCDAAPPLINRRTRATLLLMWGWMNVDSLHCCSGERVNVEETPLVGEPAGHLCCRVSDISKPNSLCCSWFGPHTSRRRTRGFASGLYRYYGLAQKQPWTNHAPDKYRVFIVVLVASARHDDA